jgi:hypothetical protein
VEQLEEQEDDVEDAVPGPDALVEPVAVQAEARRAPATLDAVDAVGRDEQVAVAALLGRDSVFDRRLSRPEAQQEDQEDAGQGEGQADDPERRLG